MRDERRTGMRQGPRMATPRHDTPQTVAAGERCDVRAGVGGADRPSALVLAAASCPADPANTDRHRASLRGRPDADHRAGRRRQQPGFAALA